MDAKHTPGPWILQGGRSFRTQGGQFYLAYSTLKTTGEPSFKDFVELDANARLIAAAPELLAALHEMLPIVAMRVQGTTDGEPLLKRARAAIAKATGATP